MPLSPKVDELPRPLTQRPLHPPIVNSSLSKPSGQALREGHQLRLLPRSKRLQTTTLAGVVGDGRFYEWAWISIEPERSDAQGSGG